MVALKWTMKNHYGVEPGRGVLGGLRRRLGRGSFLHLLCAAAARLHHGPLRGQAGRHARRRRVLARDRRARLSAACSRRPPPSAPSRRRTPRASRSAATISARFRTLFLAGERADPETIKWAEANLKVPVYDHWWQTETGWPICGNPVGLGALPVKYGSPTVPMPGYDLQVLDDAGKPVQARRDRHARRQTAAAALVPADAVGQRRSASATATSPNSRATTRPRTPATSTPTATPT